MVSKYCMAGQFCRENWFASFTIHLHFVYGLDRMDDVATFTDNSISAVHW